MFITIPTRFDRDLIWPRIEACKQVAELVIVHTEPGHDDVPEVVNVRDYSRSIQHWWNSGLDRCSGPTLVLNDDIVAAPEDLATMLEELTRADVVYLAGHRVGHATPLTGWCYGIHPDRIRPDTDFQWWGGDDDLFKRAVRDGLTISALHLPIEHRRGEAAFHDPIHAAMAHEDMKLLAERWP